MLLYLHTHTHHTHLHSHTHTYLLVHSFMRSCIICVIMPTYTEKHADTLKHLLYILSIESNSYSTPYQGLMYYMKHIYYI